jgi:hypothetical protein
MGIGNIQPSIKQKPINRFVPKLVQSMIKFVETASVSKIVTIGSASDAWVEI